MGAIYREQFFQITELMPHETFILENNIDEVLFIDFLNLTSTQASAQSKQFYLWQSNFEPLNSSPRQTNFGCFDQIYGKM